MKRAFAGLVACITVFAAFAGCIGETGKNETAPERTFADYVDPFIGTDYHGHVFPGATVPFGMVQLSPDTDVTGWDWCSGYHYSDSSVMGFSHTHLSGTGCADYGDILVMPTTGKLKTTPGDKDDYADGYRSLFNHSTESAEAGYYSVDLLTYDIKAELTATTRCGFHKYTFLQDSPESHILVDLSHGIGDTATDCVLNVVNATRIEGYRFSDGWGTDQRVFFAAEFSEPFASFGIWNGSNIQNGDNAEQGASIGFFANYNLKANTSVLVKVALSSTSIEGARKNLAAEIPGWDFEGIHKQAKDSWNSELGKIEAEGGTDAQMRTFYTALYHCYVAPNTFSDVDGKYMCIDREIHESKTTQYTLFSLWDTFRALHPLFILTQPDRNLDIINSTLAIYENGGGLQTGWLPRWYLWHCETNCMIGTHTDSIIADAYAKGLRNFDLDLAYEAVNKDSTIDSTLNRFAGNGGGRQGLAFFMTEGYVPCDFDLIQATSVTLEYAYNDFCTAVLANALGKTTDYDIFISRAASYKNVFDAETQFVRGKYALGIWANMMDFDPMTSYGYFTEGNAWQWTFFNPQDIEGLIGLFGGRDALLAKLDALFVQPSEVPNGPPDVSGMIGQYAQGNEPSHHTIHIYDYLGAPWKAQEKLRQVMETLYTDQPDGLCGNDDCGQMSAWYVFNAMGFYPFCPGMPFYTIGSPIFGKVTIHLDNGEDFVMEANGVSDANKYIQSATLNGSPLDRPWFEHSFLAEGGHIVFEMGPEPNKNWGASEDAMPPSMGDMS